MGVRQREAGEIQVKNEKTHIDLFSGIGGFALAAEWAGFETVAFCENEPFCQRVLKKHWPDVPVFDDIRSFDGTKFRGATLLTGGFPCQDISVGNTSGKGIDGERSGLWVEMCRIISEARPAFAVVENSANLLKRGLGGVLWDLAEVGYDAEWHCIPATHIGAPHNRDRIWIVAYPGNWDGAEGLSASIQSAFRKFNSPRYRERFRDGLFWNQEIAPIYRRMADGIPDRFYINRQERLKALGNAIVPQVAYEIIRCIAEIESKYYGK